MLLPRLTNCPECASIPSLLANIDCKLNQLASALYNNTIFALNQPISAVTMLDLLNYKRILAYRICNPNYAGLYTLNMIASRVIILTGNCKTKCGGASKQAPATTTTSTSAVPTTTTTSTTCIPRTTTTTSSSTSTSTTTTTHSPTTTTTTTTVVPNCVLDGTIECNNTTTTSSTSTTTTSSSSTTTTTTSGGPTTTTTTTTSIVPPIVEQYGYLYNDRIVDEPNFAPVGWRVPTLYTSDGSPGDWIQLKNYVISQGYSSNFAGVLKSTRTQPTASPSWMLPNTGALDIYGFSCLPGGFRAGSNGSFNSLTEDGSLLLAGYSATLGNPRVYGNINFVSYSGTWNVSNSTSIENDGYSARFVKEDPGTWSPGDTITDNDGNVYNTVQIGTQVWTASNWKSTKYITGSTIPMLQDNTAWASASSGAMCYYTIP